MLMIDANERFAAARTRLGNHCGSRFGITASPAATATTRFFVHQDPSVHPFGASRLYCGNRARRSEAEAVASGGAAKGQGAARPSDGPAPAGGASAWTAHGHRVPTPQPHDP